MTLSSLQQVSGENTEQRVEEQCSLYKRTQCIHSMPPSISWSNRLASCNGPTQPPQGPQLLLINPVPCSSHYKVHPLSSHYVDHTPLSSHYVDHTPLLTLCGPHPSPHIMWTTPLSSHYVDHTPLLTLCGPHPSPHIMWTTPPQPLRASLSTAFSRACDIVSNNSSGSFIEMKGDMEVHCMCLVYIIPQGYVYALTKESIHVQMPSRHACICHNKLHATSE